ncbi:hypothetical protein L1887_59880 [Cichorium endivia]|nr:hypothetical protein L1887_59880 [Cichorium endivia]
MERARGIDLALRGAQDADGAIVHAEALLFLGLHVVDRLDGRARQRELQLAQLLAVHVELAQLHKHHKIVERIAAHVQLCLGQPDQPRRFLERVSELGDRESLFRVVRGRARFLGRRLGQRLVWTEVEGAVVGVGNREILKHNVVLDITITEGQRRPAHLGRLFPVVVDVLEILVKEELQSRAER